MRYWKAFDVKSRRDSERAWLDALMFDKNAPEIATKLGLAVLSFRADEDDWITVPQAELAGMIDRSTKRVGDASGEIRDAGYFDYEPGRKNVGYSRYRLRVPDAALIEDVVSQKKTSACEGGQSVAGRFENGVSARRKLRAEQALSQKKSSGRYNSKPISEGRSDNSSVMDKGEVPLKGNPPPINTGCVFKERSGSKFTERRNAPDARSALDLPDASLRPCPTPAELAAMREAVADAQVQLSSLEVRSDFAVHDQEQQWADAIAEAKRTLSDQNRRLRQALLRAQGHSGVGYED
ncbi:hypothetical protein [Bosea sp. MMO-172]|uniref:hypothetical protein n=1 Tax=Bosea sp. MMO-172 TaxID=3127885 RepID=UPI0030192BB5